MKSPSSDNRREEGIMEAASNNTQVKPRRGRPKRFSDAHLSISRTIYPNITTHRQRMNITYQHHALARLWDDARFLWLCDREKMKHAGNTGWRPGLLAELGRIEDEDELRTCAEYICTLQPKTKIGVALIRQWRLGREAKSGWWQLVVRLEQTVNAFTQTHPSLSWKEVARALTVVLEAVEEADTEDHTDVLPLPEVITAKTVE